MKIIFLILTTFSILLAGGYSEQTDNKGNLHIFTLKNYTSKFDPNTLEQALKSNGLVIGENANIQHEFKTFYKLNLFKTYTNISFYDEDLTLELVKKYPKAGILVPTGIMIYQTIDSKDLHILLPTAQMLAKVISADPKEFHRLEEKILGILRNIFPKATHSYSKPTQREPKELFTHYELSTSGADVEDIKEELEENFEEKFEAAGFSMPSYFDLSENFGENSPYDFYVTYAICRLDALKVLAKLSPEVAALGPCTTVMYKKKDEEKIVMGFSSMYNWINSAHVEDKTGIEILLSIQEEYETILQEVTQN